MVPEPIDLAMPKSASTALPSARNRMLPGLTSRCTKPFSWAKCSPCAMSRTQSSDSAMLMPWAEPLAQGAAGNVLGGEVVVGAGLADVVHRDQVRMRQLRGDAAFLEEALGELVVGRQRRRHDLERHLAVERLLQREVDRGHAADAERPDDAIARDLRWVVGQGNLDTGRGARRLARPRARNHSKGVPGAAMRRPRNDAGAANGDARAGSIGGTGLRARRRARC